MSYEPTTWKDGDLVTSAKLNKIEQGIAAGGGILIAHTLIDGFSVMLDKTWQEIHDADVCYIINLSNDIKNRGMVTNTTYEGSSYIVEMVESSNSSWTFHHFSTGSPSDYPIIFAGPVDPGNQPNPV